jgi:hypothetical protein
MLDLAEPERSIIRLTKRERETLIECEHEVEESILEFIRCGRALCRIRSGRLYRETHATFESYCLERWGMTQGASGTLVTSFRIFEQLEADGVKVPSTVTQSAMRSLSKLPAVEGLRAACWKYATSLCPGAPCPPLSVLRRIARILRDALDACDGAGNFADETPEDEEKEESEDFTEDRHFRRTCGRGKRTPAYDERFLRSLVRLSSYQGFSVPLIVSQIGSEKVASCTWKTCERMKRRLDAK